MSNVKMSFTVVGNEEDVTSFVQLMAFISECSLIGHTGTINVVAAGDGTCVSVYENKPDKDTVDFEDMILPSKENREEFITAMESRPHWIGD